MYRPSCLAAIVVLWAATAPAAEPPVPLTVLGTDKYQGYVGGLYADGRNDPWGPHADALRRMTARVQPLDRDGKPDSKGKIVVAGIGASVCKQIFAEMESQVGAMANVNPAVVVVNCAVGGQDTNRIADPAGKYWMQVEKALAAKGVTNAQVQVVWHQSDDLRDARADFPGRPQRLKDQLGEQLRLVKKHFPSAQLCYFSGRHTTAYMPERDAKAKHGEPRPYHHGWAVKWLIEDQTAGKADLAFEGAGAVAPLAAWATYFWTAGDAPRPDGYRWTKDNVVTDGVHLSDAGQKRVAGELLTFFGADSFAKTWFLAAPSAAAPPPKGAAKEDPAWVVNGTNKVLKLRRLIAPHEDVRVIIRDVNGKPVAEVRDILHKQTDLNKLLGPGEFHLEFLDTDGNPIKLTQEVGSIVRLK